MERHRLEPGLLKIFRFFLWVQLILVLVNVISHTRIGILEGCPWHAVAFGSINIGLLLLYISFPRLQKILGRFYLPLALVYAAIFSLVLQNIFLDIRFHPGDISHEETAWKLFLFLFIPLVLVSWQYNFKAVIAYCILTAIFDYALMAWGREDFYLVSDNYGRLVFIRALSFLVAGYIISHIMKQLRRQRHDLQQANQQLIHHATLHEQLAVSRERNRMVRELHDTLAHTISGIAVQLEGIESIWDEAPDEAYGMVQNSLAATRSGLSETRRALQSLRASPLEELGLALALRSLADTIIQRAGLVLVWQVPDRLPELTPDIEQSIYRIVQEAFENIVRHAGALHAGVTWQMGDGVLQLSIIDDGRGFSTEECNEGSHYGLCGMKERAQLMGGELEVNSCMGQGTNITLKVKMKDGSNTHL